MFIPSPPLLLWRRTSSNSAGFQHVCLKPPRKVPFQNKSHWIAVRAQHRPNSGLLGFQILTRKWRSHAKKNGSFVDDWAPSTWTWVLRKLFSCNLQCSHNNKWCNGRVTVSWRQSFALAWHEDELLSCSNDFLLGQAIFSVFCSLRRRFGIRCREGVWFFLGGLACRLACSLLPQYIRTVAVNLMRDWWKFKTACGHAGMTVHQRSLYQRAPLSDTDCWKPSSSERLRQQWT